MKSLFVALAFAGSAALAAAQPAATPREKIVVTPAWLAQHLHDRNLVILHVGEKTTYEAGHIPGARFVSLTDDLAGLAGGDRTGKGLSLEMLPPDVLRDRLTALGISDSSRVIVYESDDWWSPSTRVVFTLDYAGLGAAWLDGGLAAWKAAGNQTTVDVPAAQTGKLSPLKTKPLVVDAGFVGQHAHTPSFAIVDARAPAFYDGIQPGGQRGGPRKLGHIPGAVSAPFDAFTDAETHLKAPEDIKAVFDGIGVKPGDTIVAYCHVGQQATGVLFAARTLGHPVLLYDGSFQDWVQRDLPVEIPPAKKDK